MRKTRKQLVGKAENVEHLMRELELRFLAHILHQQWWRQRQPQPTERFVIAA